MEGEAGEFADWELLHSSDETGSVNSSDMGENMRSVEGIEGDSGGMIRADYFSLDEQNNYGRAVGESEAIEDGSVESDNPSWIDPESDTRYLRKEAGEFWSDSASDRSDDRKFGEYDAGNELGFVENVKSQDGFEGIVELGPENVDLGKYWADSGGIGPISSEFEGFEPHSEMGIYEYAKSADGSEDSAEQKGSDVSVSTDGLPSGKEVVEVGAVKSGSEEAKRSIVWWKVPFEFLKFCAFRVSPVWTFSVAAAVMGFMILGCRWHKMKKKSQGLQLKVTMDEKKVSQFMSRAARLNEAFSIVKRVPVIRPPLPAAGVTPWPVMSLR